MHNVAVKVVVQIHTASDRCTDPAMVVSKGGVTKMGWLKDKLIKVGVMVCNVHNSFTVRVVLDRFSNFSVLQQLQDRTQSPTSVN